MTAHVLGSDEPDAGDRRSSSSRSNQPQQRRSSRWCGRSASAMPSSTSVNGRRPRSTPLFDAGHAAGVPIDRRRPRPAGDVGDIDHALDAGVREARSAGRGARRRPDRCDRGQQPAGDSTPYGSTGTDGADRASGMGARVGAAAALCRRRSHARTRGTGRGVGRRRSSVTPMACSIRRRSPRSTGSEPVRSDRQQRPRSPRPASPAARWRSPIYASVPASRTPPGSSGLARRIEPA